MNTKPYKLADLSRETVIELGFVGENDYTKVVIDCKPVFDEYPSAVASMSVTNPAGQSYPVIVTRDGDNVFWTVTAADLTKKGHGELQLSFMDGTMIVKSFVAETKIERSIVPEGETPDPIDNFIDRANAVIAEIPQTIESALTEAKESGEFKGDPGEKGDQGEKGDPGSQGEKGDPGPAGYTPQKGIDYFDGLPGSAGADGRDGVDGKDGKDGQDGQDGADGFSPTITVTDITGGHRVTITDATGPHSFDVMDGSDATAPVQDVQVNGTSILDDGVANIPYSSASEYGLVKRGRGLFVDNTTGALVVDFGDSGQIKQGTNTNAVMSIFKQHESAFYGLAKVAGADLAGQTVTLGQYPDPAKVAIQKMLGVYEPPYELIREITLEERANISVTTDQYGEPFQLRSVFMEIYYPSNRLSEETGYGRYVFTDANGYGVYGESGRYVSNQNACFKQFEVRRIANRTTAFFTRQVNTGSYGTWCCKNMVNVSNNTNTDARFDMGDIVKIAMNSSDYEPAGTKITIYGQRAY